MNNDDLDPAVMTGELDSHQPCVRADPLQALPSDCKIIAVTEHGTASWSSGYKIEVEVNGEEKDFFLKVRKFIGSAGSI